MQAKLSGKYCLKHEHYKAFVIRFKSHTAEKTEIDIQICSLAL